MSHWHRSFPRYVPVAERLAQGKRMALELEKQGRSVQPVELKGRTIAKTFWGKAWCENLESYSDYANRLPRGRTYVRNGSVIDLQITPGRIEALVCGSSLYEVTLQIKKLPAKRWKTMRSACAGGIHSAVELLAGTLSSSVMEVVTRRGAGLFPTPKEIQLGCTCPDWASMCKHIAAVLYGVGARLDEEPEMLFALRGLDPADLVEEAISHGVSSQIPACDSVLKTDDLAAIFGVEIDFADNPLSAKPTSRRKAKPRPERGAKPGAKKPRKRAADPLVDLSSNAKLLLTCIEGHPGLNTPKLVDQAGLTRSAALAAITKLRELGLITFEGPPRSGGYRRA